MPLTLGIDKSLIIEAETIVRKLVNAWRMPGLGVRATRRGFARDGGVWQLHSPAHGITGGFHQRPSMAASSTAAAALTRARLGAPRGARAPPPPGAPPSRAPLLFRALASQVELRSC
jgi:hypothetical protein